MTTDSSQPARPPWPEIDWLAAGTRVHLARPGGWYPAVKPGVDFALALLLLVPALPVIAACWVAVRLSSPGPGFYTQTRAGYRGRGYKIIKLRTMGHDCERRTGIQWSQKGDARVTRVGKLLRASHLDELPQLFNVLRGEMSLIGPRPERPEVIRAKGLGEQVPGYGHRQAVRPGVTGLAQIQLPADSDLLSVRHKVVYDVYYIQRPGLWLDLRILAATALKAAGLGPAWLRRLFRLPTRAVVTEAFLDNLVPPPTRRRRSLPKRGPGISSPPDPAMSPPLPRVLFLTHRVPVPPDKGDRIRTGQLLRHLAGRARVWLIALADEPVRPTDRADLEAVCERVAVVPVGRRVRWLRAVGSAAAGGSLSEGLFRSPAAGRVLRQWVAEAGFAAVVGSASSVAPPLRGLGPPAVIDLMDVDSQKWLDFAAGARGLKKRVYAFEAGRVAALERDIAGWAAAVAVVSRAEADVFDRLTHPGAATVATNGVDFDYFRPVVDKGAPGCVFVGALDYPPNVDAAVWFADEVWPTVLARHPGAEFRVVGRNPSAAVLALGRRPGVRVIGPVEDVRPHVAAVAVAVVPLRLARGVQNKVLEALAMARPTVAAPAALAALGTVPGRDLLAATTPAEWADAVSGLIADPDRAAALGAAGRRYVEADHDWGRCLQPLLDKIVGS